MCFMCFQISWQDSEREEIQASFPVLYQGLQTLYSLLQNEDLCLTLITCLTTNWHLSLRSLNMSLNPSLTVCGSISCAFSPLAPLHLILLVLISLQFGEKGAFQVVMDNYVKEEEGTGVVHQAPYFGAVSEPFSCFSSLFFFSWSLF